MNARCMGDVCSVLDSQTTEEAIKCTIPRTVDEDFDGCKLFRIALQILFDSSLDLGLAELPGGLTKV